MSLKRSADWRERAAAELMSSVVGRARVTGNVLVMLEHRPEVAQAATEAGGRVESWHRYARPGCTASAWVPAGPFDAATLRLPKAKDELDMALHAAVSVLKVGAPLWVYGANDEGARSAGGIIEPLMGPARTVQSGGRCRVLEVVRPSNGPRPLGTLEEWRRSTSVEFPDGPRDWMSYPGVFAHGRLDTGTRALLDVMRTFPADRADGRRVLDFACGSGVIGAFLSESEPAAHVDFLDRDALALAAAEVNVPGARLILSDGFEALHEECYDLIVSNPPFHEGKEQTVAVIERLIRGAPDHLAAGGSLVFVTQRRLPVAALMESTFATFEVLHDAGPHRIWCGKKVDGSGEFGHQGVS